MSDREEFEKWWNSVSNETYTEDEKQAAKAGWQAALESRDKQAPIVWARPQDIRATMIAVKGERAEVAPDKEPGFTVPLYLRHDATIDL